MNSLIGDSRVRGLKFGSLSNKLSEVLVAPGAGFSALEENVRDCVLFHHEDDKFDGKLHLYLSAGICNLTSKTKFKSYQEVIFNTDLSESLLSETKEEIMALNSLILNEGCTPIFCTVYPMSLHDWNFSRLHGGKTTHLSHSDTYPLMQSMLENAISSINSHIVELNSLNRVATPFFNRTIQHNRGKGHFNFKYNLLTDGCHPNHHLKTKLVSSLTTAINKNRRKQ